MSDGYNSQLTKGIWKGHCGKSEFIEEKEDIREKTSQLADLIKEAEHFVVHTGAGISVASGIADFRGPNGVWTCEEQNRKVEKGKPFQEAKPSFTHCVLKELIDRKFLKFIITQNVDSLHSKSGIGDEFISELHGCVCLEICKSCKKRFRRDFEIGQIGMKETSRKCDVCNVNLFDLCLDWDQELPEPDFSNAIRHSRQADLSLTLGTSLQIRPAGNLPLRTTRRNGKRRPGKLAVVNLQETPLDSKSDIRIFGYVDQVMELLCEFLNIERKPDWPAPNYVSTKNMKPYESAKTPVSATPVQSNPSEKQVIEPLKHQELFPPELLEPRELVKVFSRGAAFDVVDSDLENKPVGRFAPPAKRKRDDEGHSPSRKKIKLNPDNQ